jgi:hypothetical protein
MTKLVIVSVLALCFATGFTCSKNAPEQTAQPAADQTQMAAPADGSAAPAPADATAPSVPAATSN